MQRDCSLCIAGRGRLTSSSVEYKTGNQSLFECAESFTKRVARQLGRSDCVVKRYWNQWIREISFTRRPGLGCPRQTSRREERHIISPFGVVPRTRKLDCSGMEQVVLSNELRFNFTSDDNRVGVWRPSGERFNPAFALQRHTAPTAGVMV
ncbi:transposable element Tcb2 transposase [Trichonephila clavipes]|nr:transposable element Tcb2 transposase [Trichonephila clavipes]